jgi:hypothetical protein
MMIYRRITYLLIVLLCAHLSTTRAGFAQQLVLQYGFENWSGSADSTANYPFSSGYRAYCERHRNCSEVVSSYQDWTPRSGNYFFLRNDAPVLPNTANSGTTTTLVDTIDNQEEQDDVYMDRPDDFWNGMPVLITCGNVSEERIVADWNAAARTLSWESPLPFPVTAACTYVVGYRLVPEVTGIPRGSVNDNGYIGLNGDACSQNPLEIRTAITTGEIFIRFWARHNPGFANIPKAYPGTKWIRLETDGEHDTFMHLSTDSTSPAMMFYNSAEGWQLGSRVTLENAYDGNWHKYSFYVNFNTGVIRGWYDVENETAANATKSWQTGDSTQGFPDGTPADGRIGTATRPEYFNIQGNFCAKQPTQITYHALDDIEVWDGMPTGANDSTAPAAPQGLGVQ